MMRDESHAFFVNNNCHSEPAFTLAWESPRSFGNSSVQRIATPVYELVRNDMRIGEVYMKLQFVKAGEIVTTHGVRGEVKVLCWLDDPEMLCEFERCRISGKEYIMDQVRVQKTCNLVKLQGVDTMEAAQAMRGKIIELYREDIDDDVIFADELKGVEVFAEGEKIGKIVDVLDYPGNSVYVVKGQYEYMIPAVSHFILSTDMEANRMEVRLIEGMRSDEN